jgi:NAD(P)-dependent dehydrogenase (short-subunit alcohol dehydrogenase family)
MEGAGWPQHLRGFIGQAIARRVSAGKHVLLAALRRDSADAAAKTLSMRGLHRAF